MGWSIDPEGMYELLMRLTHEAPEVDLYVTENGAAYPDELSADGSVHDLQRIEYLEQHLAAVYRAVQAGAKVRGYFLWSLLDNFEWAYGYSKRFGIIHVDYETQQRTIKDSGHWYAALIRRNGLEPL
jgi:beta-glucosidase